MVGTCHILLINSFADGLTGLFPLFCCCEICCYEYLCVSFCEDDVCPILGIPWIRKLHICIITKFIYCCCTNLLKLLLSAFVFEPPVFCSALLHWAPSPSGAAALPWGGGALIFLTAWSPLFTLPKSGLISSVLLHTVNSVFTCLH